MLFADAKRHDRGTDRHEFFDAILGLAHGTLVAAAVG